MSIPILAVDGEALAKQFGYAEKSTHCLDFQTGKIVLAADCLQEETGDGRTALEEGKRFIRIPCRNEIQDEERVRFDRFEKEEEEHEDPRLNDSEPYLVPEMLDSPQSQEWSEDCRKQLSSEMIAQRWIASLKPGCRVGWSYKGLGVTKYYDPESHRWRDA
jgi:hypothetical protein